MASPSLWKLNALIKKNLLEMKRNFMSTLCEIFFPILIIFLFYLIRIAFDVETHDFVDEEKTVKDFMFKRSTSNLDYNYHLKRGDNYSEYKWNGLSLRSPLHICTSENEKGTPRPRIAAVNMPKRIINHIIEDYQVFNDSEPFNEENFTLFNTTSDFLNFMKDKSYGNEKEKKFEVCFGMIFNKTDENTYEYSLHHFEDQRMNGAEDIPISLYVLDQFQVGPLIDEYEKYQLNGYTYIMKVISDYIIQEETKNQTQGINFGVLPMKYESYRSDLLGKFLNFIGPFFMIIGYMGPLCIYAYKMVLEKETKVKEGMKIMGLTDGIYFMSYFIQYQVIAFFDALVNAIIFRKIFTQIPYIISFSLLFLFSLNIFGLAFFFQSFIDKAKETLIISILVYFIMFFLSLLVADEDAGYNLKVFLSLFPPVTAYTSIDLFTKFESHFRPFHMKDMFEKYTNYSIIMMNIMLSTDLIIYLFLGYYLQNVLPHDYGVRKPWYFIFKKCFCKRKSQINILNQGESSNIQDNDDIFTNLPINENFQSEEIYKDMTNPKDCFKIRNLVKQFEDGKIAVDNVNLNFYKNEIFALLGHNGAGKTTMISMLTGLYEATSGEAMYNGVNILSPENIDSFREKVGICPQHDILFMDLNIREHLRMFATFKGVPSENVDAEVNKSISDFQFEDVQFIIAKNLSAGQRRKLSIAISLIGGSEVIFLDEPSSGMDITSRRNLWEILKRQSDNKIIILTTHYMEEASVLGKRVGIINLGKMKCIGSPLFLIERFGKYMNITLSKDEGADNDTIISFISQKVERAQFESLSEEIMARIPKDNFNREEGISLSKFFEELDENIVNLKVKSYSVSMPTLEDVFLNVAAEDESQRISQVIREEAKYDEVLFGQDYLDNFEYKSKFIWDFKANFIRRIYLMLRDKKGILMEILCPILLVIIGGAISQVEFNNDTPDFGNEDLPSVGKQKIIFADILDKNLSDYYIYNTTNISNTDILFDVNSTESINSTEEVIEKFINLVYDKTKDTEATEDREIDMNAEKYSGYYGALLMLNESRDSYPFYDFVELINARAIKGVPLYTSVFLEKIIQVASTNKKLKIKFTSSVMVKTYEQEEGDKGASGTVIVFVAIAFALIPANFITIIVKERNNNSKHLMKLSGLNLFAYWLVNFLFELSKYYFTGGICILILKLFDFYEPYLEVFYAVNGPSLICMTYVVSFFFENESDAQNKMLLLHSFVGVLGSSIVVVLRGVDSTADIGKFIQLQLSPIPSFCFALGYTLAFNKIIIYEVDYEGEWYHFGDDVLIKKYNLLKGPLMFLGFEFFVYLLNLVLIEYFQYNNICRNPTKDILLSEEKNRDEGVVKEEIRALNEEINIDTPLLSNTFDSNNENLLYADYQEEPKGGFMIRIKNLRKIYKVSKLKYFISCCNNKGNLAIKNLSFCVEKGECFGLLGLNGAGKTTTFKCITQEISPTNGEILINGINFEGKFSLIKSQFGYCPQYDAIFEYLSVYENLEFYAKLKGVRQECLHDLITAIISQMRLQEFTNKISGRLSGGNKRKLSVAISMICNPPIILLDEPSTGMDPEARRFMWSVIHKMSTKGKKSSIIMTTHSMDEAETLCKRMAIMVNGEFVCLGGANDIKNTYGYGFELNLRIRPMTEKQENELYYKKYNIDNKIIVREDNFEEILGIIRKENFISEIEDGRLGERLLRDIKKKNGVNISTLLNWIFYVENAIKFVEYGRDNFSKIVIEECMENNFLFKMKKNKMKNISIGYLFGLFELHKEECFITEYSIQQTSLEQIFNKFSQNQKSMLAERGSTIVEMGDVENINSGEKVNYIEEKIVLTKFLSGQLLGEFEE